MFLINSYYTFSPQGTSLIIGVPFSGQPQPITND